MTGVEKSAGEDIADHNSMYSAIASSSQNIPTPTTTLAPSRAGSMHHNNSNGERTSDYVDAVDTQSHEDHPVLSSAGRYERLRDQEDRLVTDAARLAKMRSTFARNKLQQLAELDEHMAELQARKAEISALADDEDEQGTVKGSTSTASCAYEIDPQANDHQSLIANAEQQDRLVEALQEISDLQAQVQTLGIEAQEQAGTVATLTTAVTKLQIDFKAHHNHLDTRLASLERAHRGARLALYLRLSRSLVELRAQADRGLVRGLVGSLYEIISKNCIEDLMLLLAEATSIFGVCDKFGDELDALIKKASQSENKQPHDDRTALVALLDKFQPVVLKMLEDAAEAREDEDDSWLSNNSKLDHRYGGEKSCVIV
ncbi:hypothetical protein LTR56_009016 [Elasticomyces elasticus]|nr:hypothetical protein LTR56_009016 [Elasticomyces elasticus]KAK3663817.1 hypothetical protein LTR22_005278 [Elasticomyces elasticus]KAK4923975.1 hypothetical protein LTR49_008920 [Elasticomyces elasticus]KAK5762149.1 hypothetical protein LTS12_007670 [Elasticomyces elasticus]